MKPIIAVLLALPIATAAAAQDTGPLEVDVVGGIQAPMAIAVPAMPSTSGDVALGRQIAEIIASDLRTTGLFTPLGPGGISGYSYAEASNPVYATWRSAGAAALVAGYVEGGGSSRLTLACYLYDVTAGRELVRQGFAVNASDWRRAAHKCADLIYSRLSG